MKKTITLTLCGLMLATTAAQADRPKFNPKKAQFRPFPAKITPKLTPRLIKKPDLAVTQFGVRVLSKSGHTVNVRLTAVVKNVGRGDYVSGANQQGMSISTVGASRAAKVRNFQNLRVGHSVSLSHDFTLRLSNEFPPNWIARVGFDPDIYLDSNPKNDDTNRANNSKTLTAAQIRAIVTRPVVRTKVPLGKLKPESPIIKRKLNLRPAR